MPLSPRPTAALSAQIVSLLVPAAVAAATPDLPLADKLVNQGDSDKCLRRTEVRLHQAAD